MPSPEALRDAGMQQAENHADPRVILAIDAAIERANASGRPWSANDIRDEMPTTESKGLVGARVRAAAARRPRVMDCVDREPSDLPSTHKAEVKVWVGRKRCEIEASCEPGDHSYSWPCVYAVATGEAS